MNREALQSVGFMSFKGLKIFWSSLTVALYLNGSDNLAAVTMKLLALAKDQPSKNGFFIRFRSQLTALQPAWLKMPSLFTPLPSMQHTNLGNYSF